jgi:hypothetical protein
MGLPQAYHILILIAFIVGLPCGGVTVLDSELHHAAKCAGHCKEEQLSGQEVPSLQADESSTGGWPQSALQASTICSSDMPSNPSKFVGQESQVKSPR